MVHAFTIKPDMYNAFEDEAEQIEKCKEWGLLSEKATKSKVFFYKSNGMNLACSIIGYVDKMTAVIAFENDQQHCIHPAYLKEMQASNYGQKPSGAVEESPDPLIAELEVPQDEAGPVPDPLPVENILAEPEVKKAPKEKSKKEKAPKLQLPEEKIKMVATVQEFTTVPNHFSDTEDEVVIYEAVSFAESGEEVGMAWSSHSATLKKNDLKVGETITFEGKIVAKKLTKHPVPYKINNPAKIQKA
ncbi:hypothetical protein ACFOLF_24865 [Paenibacillus sepulcri]|uniref:Uncharacterized protein n=1 Tax=Paenibacillus sepulcri TaxID=359917 RepID=A0ABS7C2M5_9BACL|nr:hypothetical protein [Paenibacillus sepulcri]